MKPDKQELKRIEETLEHLDPANPSADAAPSRPLEMLPAAKSVQPFPIRENQSSPLHSRSRLSGASSQRHATNPHLSIGLLQQIEAIVQQWQVELEQASQQIHALYAEGPIVDGWLEAQSSEAYQTTQPTGQFLGASALRHAEIEHLKEYVDAICSSPQPPFTDNQPRSGYRLCGLDAEGQLWSRPCPPQQVAYVSLAIARYQKLRTLLDRKQTLENRLMQLVQDLTLLHGQMQDG
jgi:hypothetical protein